jgi:hypothetical protein
MKTDDRIKIRFWPHTQDPDIASYRIRCLEVSRCLSSRIIDSNIVSQVEQSDLLVLSKRYDSQSLEKALHLQSQSGTQIVLDMCDNHFHYKETNDFIKNRQSDLIRALKAVDRVIVSSEYLAKELAKKVPTIASISVIGDLIEPPLNPALRYRLQHPLGELMLKNLEKSLEKLSTEKNTRLVWFGNAGGGNVDGGMMNLELIRAHVETISKTRPVSLTVISNSRSMYKKLCKEWTIPTFYLPWSKHTISRALMLHGISIIPIQKNPFTEAKSANRITTSLIHGLAVVADSIPSYQEFSKFVDLEDWEASLNRLISDCGYWQERVEGGLNSINIELHNKRIISRWKETLVDMISEK